MLVGGNLRLLKTHGELLYYVATMFGDGFPLPEPLIVDTVLTLGHTGQEGGASVGHSLIGRTG